MYSSQKKYIQRPVFGRTLAGPPFASGEHILPSSLILRSTFACLPAAFHVHRCCALHHDGERLQLAAAPGKRGSPAPFSVSFSISLHTEHTKKGKITNGTRTCLHRVPLFAQDRTTFLARAEEACRHDEEWTHLTVTDFWAKLNQVLVDASVDLYAKETKAKISTPQDTLDARQRRDKGET